MMKKYVRLLAALAVTVLIGGAVQAEDGSGFGTEHYATQIGYDSFNTSVRKRMESTRVGSVTRSFSAAAFSSNQAMAMAPSSRTAAVAGANRRQLDCVYYSGFTVWGDMYQTWASQKTRGDSDGYKYRATAPAVGFDWTNGNITVGLATTYNWGKLKSRDYNNDRKARTWAVELYGQYDCEQYYVNATLGYANTRFRASGAMDMGPAGILGLNDKYSSNSFNIDAEVGYKMNFGGLKVVPNVGLRYFHDRRGSISEANNLIRIHASSRNYHTLELPVGVNLSYEIAAGGAIIVPRARFAWVPELSRKRGGWSGTAYAAGAAERVGESVARRARHGFVAGLGLEAKITKSISAHIDYACNFRSKAYAHHWNLGVGFTF